MESKSKDHVLIIVRGLPGSGKSTFVRNTYPDMLNVEIDKIHVKDGVYKFDKNDLFKGIDMCLKTTKDWISAGCDVVVSNTFIKREHIEDYKKIADENNARFIVFRMVGGYFKSIHDVPDYTMAKMTYEFEPYEGETFVIPSETGYEYQSTTENIE